LGYRVAILSRGYGSAGGASDEAMLLEDHLPDVPHLVGADRASLARAAMEELESDVLILDDGFQHRRLARRFDLVLIDSTEPWGFGSQLPRGLLRESPGELRRANAIMLSRCDLASPDKLAAIHKRIARLTPTMPVFESEHRPVCWINSDGRQLAVSDLQHRKMLAFCGIGNANAFFQSLEMSGGNLIDRRIYPDHHRYSRADVEELEQWAEMHPCDAAIVTTEKDLVKLRIANLGGRALWALRIGLIVRKGEQQLKQMLDRILP
jgi:tetraacyldisaccharide 4'-kinase